MSDLHTKLRTLGRWIKLAALFRSAGLNPNTMSQKLIRGAAFTADEQRAITEALLHLKHELR